MQENIPLPSKNLSAQSHDVENVIAEVFQDLLEKGSFPENVARNLAKNKIENELIKESAINAKLISETALLCAEDIMLVEKKINHELVKYKNQEKETNGDFALKELRKLKTDNLFLKVEESDKNQYALIDAQDLLPSVYLRKMEQIKLSRGGNNSPDCNFHDENDKTISKSKGKSLEKLATVKKERKLQIKDPKSVKEECVLEAVPPTVVFNNYKIDVTYQKRFKILNTSRKPRALVINKNPQLNYFRVIPEANNENARRLPSGMSSYFRVYFKTDCLLDVQDTVEISGCIVKLVSFRDTPNLSVLLYKQTYFTYEIRSNEFDVIRSQALNNSIDCGTCFLGDSVTRKIVIKNCGGAGKFFFITETNWNTFLIDSVDYKLSINNGNFTLCPAYFELLNGDFCIFNLTFFATEIGLNLEPLYLLCNNVTYEIIELLADVVVFDKYTIRIECEELLPMDYFPYLIQCYNESSTAMDFANNLANLKQTAPSTVNGTATIVVDAKEVSKEAKNKEFGLDSETTCSSSSAFSGDQFDFTKEVVNYLKNNSEVGSLFEERTEEFDFNTGIIYFGSCFPYHRYFRKISMVNDTAMELKYHWKVDENTEVLNFDNHEVKLLDKDCLNVIERSYGILGPYETKPITLELILNKTEAASYHLKLRCMILDIPKCAVKESSFFINSKNAFSKENDEELVDVGIAEFELLCSTAPMNFIFEPQKLFDGIAIPYNSTVEATLTLTIKIKSQDHYSGCVFLKKGGQNFNMQITPEEFEILPNFPVDFTISVVNQGYEDINTSLRFVIGDAYSAQYELNLKVDRPHLNFSKICIDLGLLICGNQYEDKVHIINESDMNINWEIREKYRSDLEKLQNQITVSAHSLPCGNIAIKYRVLAKEPVDWSSHLLLYATYNELKTLESVLAVYFIIVKDPFILYSELCPTPNLVIPHSLYRNETYTLRLLLNNLSKNHSVSIRFGPHFGDKAEFTAITFEPHFTTIPENAIQTVDVLITPLISGELSNIFLPCLFRNENRYLVGKFQQPEPQILEIIAMVADIAVQITLPADETENCWPEKETTIQFEENGVEETQDQEEEVKQRRNKDDTDFLNSNTTTSTLTSQSLNTDSSSNNFSSYLDENLQQYLKLIENCSNDEEGTAEKCIELDEPLNKIYGPIFKVQKINFEILNLKIRKAESRIIKIKNITPVAGEVKLELSNFPVKYLEKPKRLSYGNTWDKLLGQQPIVFKLESCENFHLEAFEERNIEIWTYANTWGIYLEELCLNITNAEPLKISIIAQVIGLPLEFPIGINCLQKFPILRFGSLSFESNEETRRLFMKNISNITISIAWEIVFNNKMVKNSKTPFRIVFEASKKDISSFEMEIKAQETKCLNIIFDPKFFETNFGNLEVEAFLLGNINLPLDTTDQYDQYSEFAIHQTGKEIQSAIVKLQANLELPKLVLNYIFPDDTQFIIISTEVLEDSITLSKDLLIKNPNDCEAIIKLIAEAPLCIDYLANDMEEINGYHRLRIKPGGCLQLCVKYKIHSDDIKNIAAFLYQEFRSGSYFKNLDFKNCIFSKKSLIKIEQNGYLQEIPYEIIVHYPKMEVSEGLNFGSVLINDVKKMNFTLKNYSKCKLSFKLITNTKNFVTKPCSGMIDVGLRDVPKIMEIDVFFIPRSCQIYRDIVTVETSIPSLQFEIKLKGWGLHNEKYDSLTKC